MCDKDYYCKGIEFVQKEAKCFSCPTPEEIVPHEAKTEYSVTEPTVTTETIPTVPTETVPTVYTKGNVPLQTVRCVTNLNH